jgi:hypothetical protein
MKFEFSRHFQLRNFMKILPVGAELFHADLRIDRQTDRHDEAGSRLSHFCERAGEHIFLIPRWTTRYMNGTARTIAAFQSVQ